MILGGARGILDRIDSSDRTVTLSRRGQSERYEFDSSCEIRSWGNLVGKVVDLQLQDFVVVGISEHTDQSPKELHEEAE